MTFTRFRFTTQLKLLPHKKTRVVKFERVKMITPKMKKITVPVFCWVVKNFIELKNRAEFDKDLNELFTTE